MNDAPIDYSGKTNRQLWAIYFNNRPRSTAWAMDAKRARRFHRAAWFELEKRLAERSPEQRPQ